MIVLRNITNVKAQFAILGVFENVFFCIDHLVIVVEWQKQNKKDSETSDFSLKSNLVVNKCYSRIAGQQSREGYGEQITNVANAPTFIVNKPHL